MAFNTQSEPISVSASGDTTLVTGAVGKNIVVVQYTVVNNVATAQAVTFKSGSTALTGAMQLTQAIGGGISPSASEGEALFVTNEGDDLIINLSAATAVAGHLAYRYE